MEDLTFRRARGAGSRRTAPGTNGEPDARLAGRRVERRTVGGLTGIDTDGRETDGSEAGLQDRRTRDGRVGGRDGRRRTAREKVGSRDEGMKTGTCGGRRDG